MSFKKITEYKLNFTNCKIFKHLKGMDWIKEYSFKGKE